ncbi:MAG: cyclic nucleotide-binding domain-containing protein [Leptospiraceae bacterium]|nr:cyclic nucleotide-binding domain-containing protein [Leptospiraceae bacterium]
MGNNPIKDIMHATSLLDSSNTREFKKGEFITSEGDASNETMYFVLSGTLSVYKNRNNVLEEINQIQAGEFFGEIALISDQPRSASVLVKSDDAKLILFSKEKFIHQAKTNPGLMFAILRAAVARIFKAEIEFEKYLKLSDTIGPGLVAKLNQNIVKANNIKILDYLQSIPSETFNKGDRVNVEGTATDGCMYFLSHGTLKSTKKINNRNYLLTKYEAGNFFGEISFFSGMRRFSTIYAETDAVVVPIDKKIFLNLVNLNPELVFQQLKNFIWRLVNTEKAIQIIKNQLETRPKDTDLRKFKKGDYIIKEGDLSNETMYFILNGELSVLKDRGEKKDEVNVLTKGDFFGELSLISNQPRTASICIKSETADIVLFSKKKFIEQTRQNPNLMLSILKATIARLLRAETSLDKLIKKYPDLETNLKIKLDQSRIENINIFKYVHSVYITNLMKGDKVFSENEGSNGCMYFLLDGQLTVQKMHNKKVFKITTLEKGDFFGEISIVTNIPRYNTVIVSSDRAKVASIDKAILERIIHLNPGFLLSLLRTVIWKLIIIEQAVTKYNIEFDMYESKL